VRQDDAHGGSVALDRSRLWLVETPQAFRREVLEAAHREAARTGASYTDDASLVEATGQAIRIVESLGRNLKITREADVILAAQLLRARR
ncbi:MAG: 2-C-methyl-D-erythritol 4-phosphate cytidylyltransferase, partial [Candidatus Binatia bacterium]